MMMDPENVYCRLCANIKPSYQQVNLQCDLPRLREINEKLERINAPTEFIETKLPSTVCLDCLRLIDQCFEFVVGIKCAQNTLSELMSKPNVKKEYQSDEDIFLENEDRTEALPEEREGYVQIKIERIIKECLDKPIKPPPTTGKPKKIEKSESLDSVPLAQLKQTWEDYSWLCTYCQTRFQKIEDLQTHSMAIHNVCNPYRCTNCKLRKQCLDTFVIHIQRHNKRLKYSCFKCFKKFKTIVGCQKHRLTHIESAELSCPGCNTTFKTEEELSQHKETYYKFKGTKTREYDLLASQIDGKTCLVCSKTFTSKGNVRMHVRRMHTVRQANHICDICGKAFYERANHAEHMMLVHTDIRPHKCHICNVAFKTPNTLKDHIGRHFNEKPLACTVCGKTFRLKKHLKKHSIIHSDKLPFQCTYCEKRFQRREYLVNHLMQHTGERPYSCEPCQIHFTNWGNYNKHMICRHNENKARKKAILVDEV